jgi:hypothetical protein
MIPLSNSEWHSALCSEDVIFSLFHVRRYLKIDGGSYFKESRASPATLNT